MGRALLLGTLLACLPGARAATVDDAGLACDRPLSEFRRTGTIRCGHFLWDLHPAHAAAMKQPLEYFSKYERFYGFLADLTGYEPKTPIPVRERCSPGRLPRYDCERGAGPLPGPTPGRPQAACPKGYNRYCFPAYREGTELFLDADSVGRDVVFTANHPDRPLFASLTHELGHMFSPFDARDAGYRWDDVMTESWADNFALLGYGMYNEVQGLGESWYWDAYCRRKGMPAPCDAFLSSVDDYASMDADAALAEYERRGGDLRDVLAAGGGHQGGRDHILTGMLVALYRDFKAQGRAAEFFDGFRKTVRFYHLAFPKPLPAGWADPRRKDLGTIERKANALVYLLSAFTQTDLSGRFNRWGWPMDDSTVRALRTLEAEGWPMLRARELLEALLRGAPIPGPEGSAAQAEGDAQERAADDEQLGEGVSQQPARLAH